MRTTRSRLAALAVVALLLAACSESVKDDTADGGSATTTPAGEEPKTRTTRGVTDDTILVGGTVYDLYYGDARVGVEARLKELNSIVWQVREYIHANLGKPTTLEPVARALGMSPRTLKRRLQEAATTFQDIKDSERFRQAMHRLEMSQDSLETIGYELGYSDASNFAKAFRSWSGISPGEYRERVMNSVNSASAAQSLTKET